MKALEVGKDYGFVFGLQADKGFAFRFLGGDQWQAVKPGVEKTLTSADSTKKAIEYINRAAVLCGMPKG